MENLKGGSSSFHSISFFCAQPAEVSITAEQVSGQKSSLDSEASSPASIQASSLVLNVLPADFSARIAFHLGTVSDITKDFTLLPPHLTPRCSSSLYNAFNRRPRLACRPGLPVFLGLFENPSVISKIESHLTTKRKSVVDLSLMRAVRVPTKPV